MLLKTILRGTETPHGRVIDAHLFEDEGDARKLRERIERWYPEADFFEDDIEFDICDGVTIRVYVFLVLGDFDDVVAKANPISY